MKPKNKFQQRVLALSQKLSPITRTQVKWGYANCIEHTGRRLKSGVITCTECAHSWVDKTTETYCTCPECHTKLVINDTKKQVFKDYQYLCIVTACEEFQVLRFVYIDYQAKVGKKAHYYHSEVIQLWIAPSSKHATIARLRPMLCFTDTWNFCSNLEIRPNKYFYNATPTEVYPRQKLIPEITRSGYTGNFHGLTPLDLFQYLLTENKAETLLKTGQTKLLKLFSISTSRNIENYWPSIRICIRNGYSVGDASIWCDYIDLLRFFGRDLRNAKYVCPTDLKAEHDRYMKKKRAWQEELSKQEDRKRAQEDEAKFQEMKSKFFGIAFSDELVQVRVLESVQEIMQEGDLLRHCVFSSKYHLRPDSLILSASIGGQRMETVEVSLSKLQIVQSRGLQNQNTEHHERILQLVKRNIPLIEKRLAV